MTATETSAALRVEAVALLRDLVRLDTVNPPGRESRAAERLRAYLERAGVACELYERTPGRASLVARLRGTGDGPSLCLLSHTDTVAADPSEWAVDPWSGELRDGAVWGRGALDDKSQAAAGAVALASLAREGFRPAGDLLLVAAADEEVNDGHGLSWLCEAQPDAVRCDYAINEGGGRRLELGGRPLYLCAVAEKATVPLRLRVRGRSGHAARPHEGDNALVKAARLVERLAAHPFPAEAVPETDVLLAILGDAPPPPFVEPLRRTTAVPTMIHASDQLNVVPGACEVRVDCRLLPGASLAAVEAELRTALGPGDYELEWGLVTGGTRSPLRTPLWDAVEGFVAGLEPEATLAPLLGSGFTDSHWLRERFGTVAHGFFPRPEVDRTGAARRVHGADERIPVADLELGVRFLRHVATAVCG